MGSDQIRLTSQMASTMNRTATTQKTGHQNTTNRDWDGAVVSIPGKSLVTLEPGERLRVTTPGGGGWGRRF